MKIDINLFNVLVQTNKKNNKIYFIELGWHMASKVRQIV